VDVQDKNRIPRWLVESDPSWEKSIDSNLGLMKWTKKGTGITAVSPPASMFCEILGQEDSPAGLTDINSSFAKMQRQSMAGTGDITKYLASRYLNPGINGPRPDLRRFRAF
jgi:hypothetical protein